MILFSDRTRLESIYKKWIQIHHVMDCAESVIAFLQIIGLIDSSASIDYKEVYMNLDKKEVE